MGSTPSLRVHQVLSISPQHETSPKSFPFTFFDTLWLRFPPVERLFFYEYTNSATSFFDSVVPNLKNSLSLSLQNFLPLVGNIIWPEDSPYPTINYVPGDSIPFIVAESNVHFNDLCSNLCDVSLRHLLIPTLKTSDEKASILSLQLTYFPNHGFCIGITTHHAAVDGKSSTLFLKAWAYICTTLVNNHTPILPENLTPFFDRSVIKDPSGINDVYAKGWLNFGEETNNRSLKVWDSISTIQDDAVKGLFELTPVDIQKLKRFAQSKFEKNKNVVRLSSFSVTCAYLLSCAVKVDQLKKIDKPKSNKVAFIFTIDCRQRLDPPIKETYFGNCVLGQLVVFETKDFLSDDDDGFVNALERIIDVLNGTLQNGVLNGAENWISKVQSATSDSDKVFSIAGSPRFEVYGVDFGWGKPKKVDVTSIDKTGAFSLSESKNNDGGIEVGLALNNEEMEVFAQLFAQGLKSV